MLSRCYKCKEHKRNYEFNKCNRSKNGLQPICRDCQKKNYLENRVKVINAKRQYASNNKEKIKISGEKYREKNKDVIKKRKKEYYEKNKTKISKKNQERIKNKLKNDESFAISARCRKLFSLNLKTKRIKKKKTFFKYTGIETSVYVSHLENDKLWDDFKDNNKRKNIHLDHIIPCSLYDFSNEEDIKKCWNPLNIRLLPAIENILKSNKIDLDLIKHHKIEHLLPEGYKANEN